ncbi:cytoplasmic protein [Candidatus Epulonipiscioides gigas]|nr:cytoplasmic protein [Epulopiscium sp. SCG-C07WGA-EpuloA2]
MIDFKNTPFAGLRTADDKEFDDLINPILIRDEEILASYKAIRDGMVFTNKRIIAINVQGLTGKKIDLTSMPYNKIQIFSVETAGTFDVDSELEIWFSGVGIIKLNFAAGSNIVKICKIISKYTL